MLSLSTVLKINAISSGATGLGLVLFATPAASLFDVAATAPFVATGVFLVLFATFVFIAGSKKAANQRTVKTIILLDSLWVIASFIAILNLFSVISTTGIIIIAAVALWVAAMAYLQRQGLRSDAAINSTVPKFGMQ